MEINRLIFTNSDCYRANKRNTFKGIMVHSTGANNPNLRRYIGPDDGIVGVNANNNHWNMPGVNKCVHGFIGRDKGGNVRVYQTLPWDWRGWHAGVIQGNNDYLSFEICEDDLTSRAYFDEVYVKAVGLCAYLVGEYGIEIKNIIGHYEGFLRGIASNHADPRHWFSKFGKSMDIFRADVANKLKEGEDMELKPVTVRVSGKTNRIPAVEGVPGDTGRTYVQLRAVLSALNITFDPLDGLSFTSGVMINTPVCDCPQTADDGELLTLLRRLKELI